jgi:hypothetical protein
MTEPSRDDCVPDAHPDENVAAEDPVQLDDEPVVEGEGGELVRSGGQDEMNGPGPRWKRPSSSTR